MKDALIISALSVVPQNWGSAINGWLARLPLGRAAHRALIRWYCRRYRIDMEAFAGRVEDYDTLADFFVRPLAEGQRPIDPEPRALVSPVDGRAAAFGSLDGHELPAGAGMTLNVRELLGDERYLDGEYAVLYLSPRDYHRVHAPREGGVLGWRYLPGRLWPVFPYATRKVDNLFAVNERLVIRLESPGLGELALVMVGAYGVGRMSLSFSDLLTNTGGRARDEHLPAPIPVARGEELGRFNLGSTVVLVAPKGSLDWTLPPGEPVQLGRPIARLR